jgi:hypothetical protein
VAVGDRYSVLASEQCPPDEAEAERLVGAPMRAGFERGIASGLLRQDLPATYYWSFSPARSWPLSSSPNATNSDPKKQA